MNWITGMQNAINYIENNITEEIDYSEVAKIAYSSSFHFQRVFSILCGFTIGEYIRYRRLSLASEELATTNDKIINIALKYGYDTPESFTKAFTRFHGATPTAVRRLDAKPKSFNRLSIQLTMDGGEIMDYKIERKPEAKSVKKFFADDLETVRKYPRTFLGAKSKIGLHHMLYEILTYSIVESLDGHCTNINVKIHKNNVIEISDNGRGIPTAINRETGISILESTFTTVYDRGEGFNMPVVFDGLEAVGLGIINALSEWLVVEVSDGKYIRHIKFQRGKKTNDISIIGKTNFTGTTIRVKPDEEIFDDTEFDYIEILSKLEEQASLHNALLITLTDQRITE
jgi:AraC-like DNA-binding protein